MIGVAYHKNDASGKSNEKMRLQLQFNPSTNYEKTSL